MAWLPPHAFSLAHPAWHKTQLCHVSHITNKHGHTRKCGPYSSQVPPCWLNCISVDTPFRRPLLSLRLPLPSWQKSCWLRSCMLLLLKGIFLCVGNSTPSVFSHCNYLLQPGFSTYCFCIQSCKHRHIFQRFGGN